MSFLEIVGRASSHLQKRGRISLRALRREFDLDDDAVEDLVEERVEERLEERVDVQQVTVREDLIVIWAGESALPSPAAARRDPLAYTPVARIRRNSLNFNLTHRGVTA